MAISGSLKLALAMKGMIQEPFDIPKFALGNFLLGAEVKFAGGFTLGKSRKQYNCPQFRSRD